MFDQTKYVVREPSETQPDAAEAFTNMLKLYIRFQYFIQGAKQVLTPNSQP